MTRAKLAADVADACLEGGRVARPEAVGELFRTHGPMVQSVIGRVVGPTPDFEDLVQTTFLEALGNLERFRGEAKVSTWLCGIAVHVAHHYLRACKVRRHVPLEVISDERDATATPALVCPSSTDQSMDAQRLAAELHAALDRIAPKKRVALLLYVMEDRSVAEIAALMGATRTATRSRMFLARRELRHAIRRDPALRELAEAFLGDGPRRNDDLAIEARAAKRCSRLAPPTLQTSPGARNEITQPERA